jgi:hypothetical protein
MNFSELCKPYEENGRTPQGQIKWLQSKGIPQDKIDQAMLHVYNEMEQGRTFENGHEFDRYLLETAEGFHKSDLNLHIERMEKFFDGLLKSHRDKWEEGLKKTEDLKKIDCLKLTLWQRIKAVFKPCP